MRTALAILALVGAAYAVLDNFDPHPLDTNPGGTKAHVHRSGGTTYIDAEVVALEAATGDWVGATHRLSYVAGTDWILDGEPVVDVIGDLHLLLR